MKITPTSLPSVTPAVLVALPSNVLMANKDNNLTGFDGLLQKEIRSHLIHAEINNKYKEKIGGSNNTEDESSANLNASVNGELIDSDSFIIPIDEQSSPVVIGASNCHQDNLLAMIIDINFMIAPLILPEQENDGARSLSLPGLQAATADVSALGPNEKRVIVEKKLSVTDLAADKQLPVIDGPADKKLSMINVVVDKKPPLINAAADKRLLANDIIVGKEMPVINAQADKGSLLSDIIVDKKSPLISSAVDKKLLVNDAEDNALTIAARALASIEPDLLSIPSAVDSALVAHNALSPAVNDFKMGSLDELSTNQSPPLLLSPSSSDNLSIVATTASSPRASSSEYGNFRAEDVRLSPSPQLDANTVVVAEISRSILFPIDPLASSALLNSYTESNKPQAITSPEKSLGTVKSGVLLSGSAAVSFAENNTDILSVSSDQSTLVASLNNKLQAIATPEKFLGTVKSGVLLSDSTAVPFAENDTDMLSVSSDQSTLVASLRNAGMIATLLPTSSVIPSYSIDYPVASQQWSQAIGHRMISMARSNQHVVSLTVRPGHDEPITLKLSIDNQNVSVKFISEQIDVREALQKSLPLLSAMLERSGMQLSHADVSSNDKEHGAGPLFIPTKTKSKVVDIITLDSDRESTGVIQVRRGSINVFV